MHYSSYWPHCSFQQWENPNRIVRYERPGKSKCKTIRQTKSKQKIIDHIYDQQNKAINKYNKTANDKNWITVSWNRTVANIIRHGVKYVNIKKNLNIGYEIDLSKYWTQCDNQQCGNPYRKIRCERPGMTNCKKNSNKKSTTWFMTTKTVFIIRRGVKYVSAQHSTDNSKQLRNSITYKEM